MTSPYTIEELERVLPLIAENYGKDSAIYGLASQLIEVMRRNEELENKLDSYEAELAACEHKLLSATLSTPLKETK